MNNDIFLNKKKIWLSSPHISKEGYEMQYIREAFDTNWIAPLGTNVNEFERELAGRVGVKHAAALSSGTAALHMALRAVGVDIGDKVFCQSLTFAAAANPIVYQNAIPVFIDSDYETWNMDPYVLEKALEKYEKMGNKPKAVIVVHLYGLSTDMDKIMEICRRYQVTLIEDAAESLGTRYKGKYVGTLGEYGVYSFNGNKIITTSGGGMLVSNNGERIEKVRFWSTQSKDRAKHYQHSELGFNYRMSNVVAGIGRGQLKVLDERIAKKKYIFEFYKMELGKLEGVEFMPINEWNEPNYWLSCITLSGKVKPLDIITALEEDNIESRPVWKPMHMQPFFKGCDYVGSDVSEKLFENGVCLPSDTNMTDDDLERVCGVIKGLWTNKTFIGSWLVPMEQLCMKAEAKSNSEAELNKSGIYGRFIKRLMGIILSLVAIIFLSPVFIVVAILVRIKLGSPVLFKQKRPGLNEKIFTMYKFRTMTDGRDEKGEPLSESARLTGFGRSLRSTSLDELPELFNILKGDMSIVGPRPLAVQYLSWYTTEEKRRHDVRPGLTGLAQISGRNALGWEDKFAFDIQYIDNMSLKNDIVIIFKTLGKVFKRTGIGERGTGNAIDFDVYRQSKREQGVN